MIDIHCHLLPEIDDGPTSIGHSLNLALTAVNNGIERAVVTPHIHPGRYENDLVSIKNNFLIFKEALESHDMSLELGMAAEVRLDPEILPMFDQGLIPFLGEYHEHMILLLELPHSHIPLGSEKFVELLLKRGIRPMIAHPERNKDIIRDLEKLTPFVELDCLFQVTAGSVAGAFGDACQQRAHEMLEHGWVNVLASDAHNIQHRPPDLNPGRIAAEKIIGESSAWDLVSTNPLAIVQSQFTVDCLKDYV